MGTDIFRRHGEYDFKKYSMLNLCLIKTKDKSKHLSKNILQRQWLQKHNFVRLMMRFSYFLNKEVITNVKVNIMEQIRRVFSLSMKEQKKYLMSHRSSHPEVFCEKDISQN